jgi:hypothetical protein
MAGTASLVAGTAQMPPQSYGSVTVNGQLVGAQTRAAYAPINYGGGISAVPAASPLTTPPSVGYGFPASAAAAGSAVASTPGAGNTTPNGQQRGGTSYGIMGSPGLWAWGMMAAGLLWLRYVHWKR